MENSSEIAGILDASLAYLQRGLPIIPLHGKVPAIAGWQKFAATPENCRQFFGAHGCNIGLRTGESGYVLLDTDTDQAEEWVRRYCSDTPLRAITGSGSMHRYFAAPPRKEIRNHQGLRGIHGLDVRGYGGYVVLPPSIHPITGLPYRWLTELLLPEQLPVFSPSWVYRRPRRSTSPLIIDVADDQFLRHVAAYVARIEPAISHQGGHNKTFYAACRIAELVDGDPALTWHFLQLYNARCLPPWSERELRHKWADALKRRK